MQRSRRNFLQTLFGGALSVCAGCYGITFKSQQEDFEALLRETFAPLLSRMMSLQEPLIYTNLDTYMAIKKLADANGL